MNKIYRIIWNSTLNAWVVVSELTRNHTKRASATAAVAVLATLLSATAQASGNASEGGNVPNTEFDPNNPTFDDEFKKGEEVPNYKFGLVVVGNDGKVKTNFGSTDTEQGKNNISVEASNSSEARPENKTSYLYLRENGGIEIDQEGRSAKFKVKTGDGLKIDTTSDKLVADTVNLTVTNGKVSALGSGDDKKLVNAGDLVTALNSLSWTAKAGKDDSGESENETDQEVKAGDKVTFKAGDNLKIKQNGKDFTYSLKKDLTGLTSVETEKLSFGANGNKVNITSDTKGLNFAKETTGANGDTTVHLNGIGSTLYDTLSNTGVTTNLDGNGITDDEKKRAASIKDVLNAGWNVRGVKPASTNNQVENIDFVATYDTVDFISENKDTTSVTVESKDNGKRTEVKIGAKTSVIAAKDGKLDTGTGDEGKGLVTAKTVIDAVNKSGWRVKTTDNNQTGQKGGNFETVTSGTNVTFADGHGTKANVTKDESGNITVKYDVKTDGSLTVNNGDGKLKLNILDERDITNLLVLGDNGGVTVRKGEFNDVTTEAGQANGDNRGKVTVKNVADLENATEDDKKRVATVVDVAKAINEAATFVKVESDDTEIDDTANGNTAGDQAIKAGDTLTLKAGKNLKVKREGKEVTFALAKDLEVKTAKVSDKLSIGKDENKVDISSDANGLNLAKAGNGNVYLNGLDSTLTNTLDGAATSSVTRGDHTAHYGRAATVKDVLNSGWNIKGVTTDSTTGKSENVDFVRTYDTVEFLSADANTTTVTVDSKDGGARTEVKIGAKTSVIKEKDGKLVTGKGNKEAGGTSTNATEDTDEGTGLVTAKTVIDAVNKSGWRVTGEGTTAENGATAVTAGQAQIVTSGTSVNFKNGNATTATVSKDNTGNINVKYDVNVGDGLKVDDTSKKIVADTTTLTVNSADGDTAKPKGKVADVADDSKNKLVKAGDLVTALNSLSWTATAGKDGTGEVEPETPAEQEVKAGDKVTFKAGNNLKVKQDGANFTYSLKDALTGLTSITLGGTTNGGTTGATTQITNEGLTITPVVANGGTAKEEDKISVTKDGISAGNKAITNVASGLTKYTTGNDAKKQLVDLSSVANAAGGTTTNNGLANKAATVGDLAGLGWVLSSDKTTNGTGTTDTAFHSAVKNAEEVEFKGTGKATVSAKTENGKHTVTIDVAETKIEVSDGIEKTTDGKLKLKAKTGDDNLLTVGTEGASVAKGKLEVVSTTANGDKKGQVKAKGANGTDAATDKDVATVKDVADAINSAAWIAKVENTDDSVDTPTEDDEGTAVKAGDTLNLKAGKNLKAKRDGQNITFALAKDITVETANVENTLTIGKDGAKVNIASGASGLTLTGTETAADGSTNNKAPVYLNGIKPTLTDTLAGGTTAHIVGNIDASAYHRAASVQDVLNAGWNIRGAKQAGGEVENVDFVRTYDTVDFVSGNKATTDVTVAAEDGGKRTVVTITAKNDVGSITTADGKVVVGTNGKASTDSGAGNKVAKTGDVANAINQSGWKTNATKIDGVDATDTDKTQLINPGDAVNYENGNGTVANVEVTQGKDGKPDTVSVKYDVKAADKSLEVGVDGVKVKVSDGIETTENGIKAKAGKGVSVDENGISVKADDTTIKVGDDGKVTAVTGETETLSADADGKKKGQLKAKDGDGSKLATVESVANAVNSVKWYAKADNDQTATVGDTDKTTGDDGEAMGAGDALTLTAGKNLRVKRDGGKFTFATVETPEFEGLKLVQGGNTVNIAPTANGLSFSRPAATAGGKGQPVTLGGISSGLEKFDAADPKTEGLLNLNKTEAGKTEPAVGDNTVATVGDLRGMGWVLSADKKTDNLAETYNAQVKNAEEVKFVGASGVIVSGKTEGNVRTITVGVDHQLATNNSVKSVEYTKKDGTKVYPKTVTKNDGTTETKFYPNADGTGDEVPAGDVIVSVNGANGTKSPTTLSNVKSNLPETRNTADAANPASKSQSAPTIGTADGNVNANNAATVGDVLNSGWNLKGNGSAVDFVRAYDTVNFVNGKGTTVSIETDGAESRVKVDVDTGVITAETKDGKATGKVAGPVANAADLSKAIKDAQDELAKAGDEQAKKAAQTKLDTANKAADEAGLNKVATAQNVADMINNSGFTLKTSATAADDNLTADNTLKNDGEVINLGKTVEMVAGKNLTVKQEADGKVTYAIKDDVEFATVKVGKDEDGKKPVSLTTEKAVNASNNETGKEPATALKISSDGKPTQLVGVASVLNTSEVTTKPDGDKKADGTPAESKTEKLIDLAGTDTAPVNKNAAATVGDLQSMGWVVSTKDGNGYTDVVKNAGKVDFKGGDGIEVRGSTAADGTRVITVSAKEGKVTNKVEITKNDGSKVDAVIIDGKYYERDENGKPKTDTEIPAADIKAADNGGLGFVTGNTVANAINDSGWNVGLADGKKAEAAFAGGGKALSDSALEKVNPDDNLRFADGKNTKVKAATVDEINKDGRKITNTYVKFDVDLPISQIENVSRDAEGNAVKKVGDKWYPADQVNADGTLKDPGNSTALSDEEAEKVATGNVMAIDPENKGDKYKSANQVEKGLTPEQMGELVGKQTAAAEAAKLKIENLLKNQPKDVVDAASEAAVKAAQDEAKAQYLKEKGLDKGTGGTVISNLARGTAPGDAVNVDQLQNSGWNLDSKAVAGSSGKVISGNVSPSKVKMDETVNIDAGNNIEITRNGKNIGIATSMTPQFSSVSLGAGADAPTLSVDDEGALNVGSKDANKPVRITNVAPGVKDGDVANVAQLKGSLQNLNNRIDNVDGNARAGIAQAIATAGLVQAYLPGKSMMAIGGGTYRGEAGYAIGYSSISDGGNWVIKGTASGNSRGHFGASASVGYQW
ncbi:YadA-like family protein [Neisseria sp. Marseille-Q6792]|uniref:ESPR-type extended signal peptide-containing protein n=1 Tax=Neisseria sp. Marseille-Q6792 TaxID=2937985 RepID=UPI002023E239|nr:YadA-like family protein [Neisseria sp. Marseille-Q6792]